MRRSATILFTLLLLFASGAAAAPPLGLEYQLPRGWIDLRNPDLEDSRIPQGVVDLARRGPYIIYAVDPENLSPVGANASFNVIEIRGKGPVTSRMLANAAAGAAREAEQAGFHMQILDTKVVKLGGVDVGRTTSLMAARDVTMRLLQYYIPGREFGATLTYACLPGEYERYRPIFEESAMATRGAYAHRGLGLDWGRAFRSGSIGAFLGAIGGVVVVMLLALKKRSAAPQPAPVPASAALVWECPTCKRRVPARIDQCRCGAPRPD